MWTMACIQSMTSDPITTWRGRTNWLKTMRLCGRGWGRRGCWEALGVSSHTNCPLGCTSLWLPFCLRPMQGHGADCQCVIASQSGWGRQWLLVWQWGAKSWKDLKSIGKSFLKTATIVLMLVCLLKCLSVWKIITICWFYGRIVVTPIYPTKLGVSKTTSWGGKTKTKQSFPVKAFK